MFSGHCDIFGLFFALWQKFMRVVLYAQLLLLSWCRSCIAGGVLFRLHFFPVSSFSRISVSFYPFLTGVLPFFIFFRCGHVALIHFSSSYLLHPCPDFTFFPLFSRLFRSFIFLCHSARAFCTLLCVRLPLLLGLLSNPFSPVWLPQISHPFSFNVPRIWPFARRLNI